MDFEINTKGKNLFLSLSTISLILMMIVTTILWWFVAPRLEDIHEFLRPFSLTLLRIFYFIVILGITLVYLTSYTKRNFLIFPFAVRISIQFLFPITILFGKTVGITKDKVRESYVHVNNSFIKVIRKKFKNSEVLILLPHCLQNTDCGIRITVDINKCVECGKCDIGDLTKLAVRYKVPIAIATGGTLARRIIVENRPKFIIAVACERDLVDGLHDVFPIPVYGVLNERPEGPCVNTRVAVKKIEKALESIIK